MMDSSSIGVHQHAANGDEKGEPGCLGRSRGDLTTKIYALIDANGVPIRLKLTVGQVHDGRSAAGMFDIIGEIDVLFAGHAYDAEVLIIEVAARGARTNI